MCYSESDRSSRSIIRSHLENFGINRATDHGENISEKQTGKSGIGLGKEIEGYVFKQVFSHEGVVLLGLTLFAVSVLVFSEQNI